MSKETPSDAQDRRDIMTVARLYLDTARCVGGRIVHRGYVCPHCDSTNPSDECFGIKGKDKVTRGGAS